MSSHDSTVDIVPGDLDVAAGSASLNRSGDSVRSGRKDGSVGQSSSRAQGVASSDLGLNAISSSEGPLSEGTEGDIARVLLVVKSISKVVGLGVNVGGRAEVSDGGVSSVLGLEVDLVSLDGSSIRVRSVPGESNALARGGNLNLRCVRGTSRGPDLSGNSTESTSVASSDGDFVRGGAVVLIDSPGKTLSSSTGLGLPDTSDHLLISDGVGGSANSVVVGEVVVAVNGLPVGGDFASGEFGEFKASDSSSFGLNSEVRLSSGSDTTSLAVASVSSGLHEVVGGEREGALHQVSHGDGAGKSVEIVAELVVVSKGLVAVSVLVNGSPLASSSLEVVSSAHAHVVSVNAHIGASSVLRGGPGEDNGARILGDSKSGSVGAGNSGDHEVLRPVSGSASADSLDSEVLSNGSRSFGGLVRVALHVLGNGCPVDDTVHVGVSGLNVVAHILVLVVAVEQVPGNGSELGVADLADFSRSGDLRSNGVDHSVVVQVSSGVGSAASRVAGGNLSDNVRALAVVVRSSHEGLHGDGARVVETLSVVNLVGAGSPGKELLVSTELVSTSVSANVELVAGDGAGVLHGIPGEVEEASGVGVNTHSHSSGGLANIDRCLSPQGVTARVSRLDSE